MTVDKRLEALYGKVELVRGVGKPRHGQLCIMSLVAFLAGERHSDHPNTASPAIRSFAITINDEMPDDLRGRLKPFAPAIIGTRDELDLVGADADHRRYKRRILPRICVDFVGLSSGDGDIFGHAAEGIRVSHVLRARLAIFLNRPAVSDRTRAPGEIAAAAADLLVCCAREARSAAVSMWYLDEGDRPARPHVRDSPPAGGRHRHGADCTGSMNCWHAISAAAEAAPARPGRLSASGG